MSNLYERLTELCESKGITGSKMCQDIGYNSRNLLSELKSGRKKSVSADIANRISTYFGVSVSYLLGETDERFDDVEEKQNELFQKRKLLFNMTGKATKEQLEQIEAIIKTFGFDDD